MKLFSSFLLWNFITTNPKQKELGGEEEGMAVEDSSLNDEDSDFFSIGDVIEAVQALPNMDDELILDAADFLENKKNAQIFMALGFELRRKWLIRKLPRQV